MEVERKLWVLKNIRDFENLAIANRGTY